MAAFLDLCRFVASAGGTTDWTYSSTVSPYISPTAAGAVNSRVYKVRAESADLTQWEVSEGAYSSAGAGSFAASRHQCAVCRTLNGISALLNKSKPTRSDQGPDDGGSAKRAG